MGNALTSYFGRALIDHARYCIDHVSRELAASQGSEGKKKQEKRAKIEGDTAILVFCGVDEDFFEVESTRDATMTSFSADLVLPQIVHPWAIF